jgi:UDP-3-O-[3-hydroxymyristoyl] glucosamine N-acyltransferase
LSKGNISSPFPFKLKDNPLRLTEFKNFDPSTQVIYQKSDELFIEGLCDFFLPKENHLLFIGHKKYLHTFSELESDTQNNLGVIIEKKLYEGLEEADQKLLKGGLALLCVDNIPLAMSWLSRPFYERLREECNDEVDGRQMGSCEIHPSAVISQNVFLGKNVVVEEGAIIHSGVVVMSDSYIGKGSVLFPGVTLYPRVRIGQEVIIHGNTVLGADGFGFNFKDGVHHKVWHCGGVIVEDHVEVGSNTSIDGGTFSPTVLGRGSKIDNLVQIAHNVKIGPGAIICGQVGLSGSSRVGDYTVMGGRAALGPDCEIGAQSQIAGNAMVTKSCPQGSVLGGHPARPLKEWMKGVAYLRKESMKNNKK